MGLFDIGLLKIKLQQKEIDDMKRRSKKLSQCIVDGDRNLIKLKEEYIRERFKDYCSIHKDSIKEIHDKYDGICKYRLSIEFRDLDYDNTHYDVLVFEIEINNSSYELNRIIHLNDKYVYRDRDMLYRIMLTEILCTGKEMYCPDNSKKIAPQNK